MCTVKRVGYYVFLKESLRKLLEMPEVWQQIDKCHYRQDQFMHDVCDGRYILTDIMFWNNSKALQNILKVWILSILRRLIGFFLQRLSRICFTDADKTGAGMINFRYTWYRSFANSESTGYLSSASARPRLTFIIALDQRRCSRSIWICILSS